MWELLIVILVNIMDLNKLIFLSNNFSCMRNNCLNKFNSIVKMKTIIVYKFVINTLICLVNGMM